MIIFKESPEGNAFNILGKVKRLWKEIGKPKEEIERNMEDLKSGDYDHLCKRVEELTFGTIKIRSIEEDDE